MKNYLSLTCAFTLIISGIQAQELQEQTTDVNGKTFFQTSLSERSILEQEQKDFLELDLDWSNPDYNVSNNPTVDSWNPRMSVTSDGTVHVVYNDNHSNGLQKIMYRKKSPEGDWTDPIFVDTGGEIGDRNNHFPSVSASENGDVHVTYNVWAYENVRNYVAYSYYEAATDTWNDGVKVSDLLGTVNHTSGRHDVFIADSGLPVAVWGYDYRENLTNEEIYLSYFDGTDWSTDIAVSDLGDNLNAGYPHVAKLGDAKTMILFTQSTSSGVELGYKIYDEVAHTLTDFQVIPVTNTTGLNYSIASNDNNEVTLLTMHTEQSPLRAAFTTYTYDNSADEFTANGTAFEVDSPTSNSKNITIDCNEEGDCGIIYTDFQNDNNMFIAYNETDGYTEPLLINSETPALTNGPTTRFDAAGNLHVVWADKRADNDDGWDEREVAYEMGAVEVILGNTTFDSASLVVYPNPSNGVINIKTQDAYSLEIFDLLGRSISTQEIDGPTSINSINVPGTYFLHFSGQNKTLVKKVIIK
ncbi:hypothetical protein SCB49_11162 [unidentified eubacterium SCB49]|nr:hypothetical protein SCB49_11162 [unidentified eubacterium SCB49]